MLDARAALAGFPRRHDFLLCLDSDGCVFNTMEIKQERCIIPNLIRHWRLQEVAGQARQAAGFVNLYSRHRGINRWPALILVLDLLAEWEEVRIPIPRAQSVRDWIGRESRLSNQSLRAAVDATSDPELEQALAWSEAVNRCIEVETLGVAPFPLVRETLERIAGWADILVCSTTAQAALEREWTGSGLARYATLIAGQEMGPKAEHIRLVAEGRYRQEQILMVGDAPGDLAAARANGARFYPIRPGREVESWRTFTPERYSLDDEQRQVEAFLALLPETPPWKLV